MAEQHEKALVPQIRFTGFTDPWEQRKLGEIAEVVGGGTPSTDIESYWDGDIDWYSPAELGDAVYADSSVRKITLSGYQSCSATMLPAGKTILFTSRAGIGNTAILRRSGCTNQGFQSLVINDETDVYFVYSMSGQIKKYAEQKASGSTFLEISGKALAAGRFAFPSLDEQRLIGAFFDRLDSLITLHQRKYDKLCVLKKSMLDKMFPKGGSLYPEIRFAGFTDPWEQRKLGQHLKLSRELGHTGVDARKLTVKLWGKGVVEKTDLYGGSAQTQYYIRHAGQFMYGKLDFLHAAFGVVPDKLDCFESTLDSPAFDIEGLDSSFLLNLVTQEDFYLKNGNIANGSRKAKRIHEETFLNMEIRAPELVEQRRIGAFLDRLDSLITLHQRKLELLRNIKKSMLDKMFV